MRRTIFIIAALASLGMPAVAGQAFAQADRRGGVSLATMHRWSEQIAHTYLQRWSSGDARALADVPALYGPRVSFYGQFINQKSLFDQKRRFGRRWPIRRYEHRPGTMRVTCDATTRACLVRSIIDYQAASPARNALARGTSTFELGISFSGPKPVVLFERGRVIRAARRRTQAQGDFAR